MVCLSTFRKHTCSDWCASDCVRENRTSAVCCLGSNTCSVALGPKITPPSGAHCTCSESIMDRHGGKGGEERALVWRTFRLHLQTAALFLKETMILLT